MPRIQSRRKFLEYLAASPALLAAQQTGEFVIEKPEDAINVMEFEAAARKRLPPAHFGYIATGVEDDWTLRANREAFAHYQLRPRRLVDVRHVEQSVELFGTKWKSPIILAPTGSHKAFFPEGEIATARAARSRQTLQVLSTATTTGYEDVSAAYGAPVWYQLYCTTNWAITEKLIRRVDKARCPVLVVTVDLPAGRKTETEIRFKRMDKRPCQSCHGDGVIGGADYARRKPMFTGIEMKGEGMYAPALNWESIRQMRKITGMKILIKGIVTREDAVLCRENGLDGVIVSNHGGRAEESGRGSLDCLPEVVDGVAGAMPVLVDGGFRRGSDIFKALALGARAVCIGRPYLWGLGAFGEPGVAAVIDMLRAELDLVMKQCGTHSLHEITSRYIQKA